jgi:acyl-CoA thioester hydrolase
LPSNYYDFDVRIAYADTDRMGVVYYANYLVLFERGRTEFLRNAGYTYKDMEEKLQVYMPVVEAHCDYFAPGRYDDLIRVRTYYGPQGFASVRFRHEIYLVEGNRLIAKGFTKHAVVNQDWKPTRLPNTLREKLEGFVSE